jgi:hypothetical protein
MKGKRFTDEQVTYALRPAEASDVAEPTLYKRIPGAVVRRKL